MYKLFSKYGFNSDVSHKSYLSKKGAFWPSIGNSFESHCKSLYHDHYDMEIPMLSAVMPIVFDGNVSLTQDYAPDKPIILMNEKTSVKLNGKKITAPVFC